MFGNPETPPRTRLEVLRVGTAGYPSDRGHQDGDAVVGNRTKVKVVKNKVASPFREADSTSFMAKESPRKATCWTWVWPRTCGKEWDRGSATKANASAGA